MNLLIKLGTCMKSSCLINFVLTEGLAKESLPGQLFCQQMAIVLLLLDPSYVRALLIEGLN